MEPHGADTQRIRRTPHTLEQDCCIERTPRLAQLKREIRIEARPAWAEIRPAPDRIGDAAVVRRRKNRGG